MTLSGGQQMRVALARALYQRHPRPLLPPAAGGRGPAAADWTVARCCRPALLFADDPLAAVDARVGAHLFRSLREYATGEQGRGGLTRRHRLWRKVCVPRVGGRAVVLALNQLHLARRCSRLASNEEGSPRDAPRLNEIRPRLGSWSSKLDASRRRVLQRRWPRTTCRPSRLHRATRRGLRHRSAVRGPRLQRRAFRLQRREARWGRRGTAQWPS